MSRACLQCQMAVLRSCLGVAMFKVDWHLRPHSARTSPAQRRALFSVSPTTLVYRVPAREVDEVARVLLLTPMACHQHRPDRPCHYTDGRYTVFEQTRHRVGDRRATSARTKTRSYTCSQAPTRFRWATSSGPPQLVGMAKTYGLTLLPPAHERMKRLVTNGNDCPAQRGRA